MQESSKVKEVLAMVEIPGRLDKPAPPRLPLWLRIVVVVGALLMAAGGIIALVKPSMLVSPGDAINGAVRIYAGYLTARALPLALLLIVALSIGARRALGTLMLLTAFVQATDAVIDCVEGRWSLVPGVLIFSLVFFIGAARITGRPFWNPDAWRDSL